MHAFDILGDPVRRRILELLASGERSAGAVCAAIQEESGISQPAGSWLDPVVCGMRTLVGVRAGQRTVC